MSDLSRVDTDDRLVDMWLNDRPLSTQASYRRTVKEFRLFVAIPLAAVRLEELQAYVGSLKTRGLKESTRRQKLNAVKSMFSYAAKLQYIRFNVAAALRVKQTKHSLAGRFIPKGQVRSLLGYHPIIRLMYGTGLRVSEACGLLWGDLAERDDGSVQARVLGKGQKERVVLVPEKVWAELRPLRGAAADAALVFGLNRFQAHRIVKSAVREAGLSERISCHFLRHQHAIDSLRGGAPLQLVRDSLGHSSIAVTNVYLESNPDDGSSRYLNF